MTIIPHSLSFVKSFLNLIQLSLPLLNQIGILNRIITVCSFFPDIASSPTEKIYPFGTSICNNKFTSVVFWVKNRIGLKINQFYFLIWCKMSVSNRYSRPQDWCVTVTLHSALAETVNIEITHGFIRYWRFSRPLPCL